MPNAVDAFREALGARELSRRVVGRFLIAKGGVALVPEYQRALKLLEAGDATPMMALGQKVIDIITPGGGLTPPDWFGALGVPKRNAILSLRKDALRFQAIAAAQQDPKNVKLDYGLWRSVSGWGKDLRTLELATVVGDVGREIKHGPFVVVPVPGVTQAQQNIALEALDAATDKIRAKFPQVLYGKVFLATHLSRKTVAHYVVTSDTIHLDVGAQKRFDDIHTICHEFGHRYEDKFLDKKLKAKFWELSTQPVREVFEFDAKLRDQVADEVVFFAKERALGRTLPKMSSELEAWLRSPDGPSDIRRAIADFLTGKIDEKKLHALAKGTKDAKVMGKVLREPLAVTDYGGTKPSENWAEAFAHYVMGKPLAPELAEILDEAR